MRSCKHGYIHNSSVILYLSNAKYIGDIPTGSSVQVGTHGQSRQWDPGVFGLPSHVQNDL